MRKLILFLLLASAAVCQQVNTDIIPATSGLNLGHTNQRWTGHFQNVDITGSCTVNGLSCITGMPTNCTANQVMIFNGTQWVCETLSGGGTITGVTTTSASGLQGGASVGNVNLSLLSCSTNQVEQFNGSSWVCANVGSGTLTGVTTASGSGLTGGGLSGTLNMGLITTCSTNQVLAWNGSAWACANSGGSGLPPGTGLPISVSSSVTLGTTSTPTVDIRWFFNNPFPTSTQATSQDFGAVLANAFAAAGVGGQCVDLSGLNTVGTLYATSNPYSGMGTTSNPCITGGNFTIVTGVAWETPAGSFTMQGSVPPTLGSGLVLQPCNTVGGCVSAGGLTVSQYPSASSCASAGGLNCWATGLPSSSALSTYTTGTITCTNGTRTCTGSGTTWTSSMVGGLLLSSCATNSCTIGSTSSYVTARIVAASATSLTLEGTWSGLSSSGENYIIFKPNTPVVLCDGCLTTSAQKASTGRLFRNFGIDVNGVGGGVGYYTRAVQEGTEYDNVVFTLQQNAGVTGAAAAGACAAWDNTLREANASGQTFTGHYYMFTPRCGMGQNAGGSTSYGYEILGYSTMDGSVGASAAAGPGFFDIGAVIGGSGGHRFQDGIYIDGLFDGRWRGGHMESVLSDMIEVGAVNPVYGQIIDGVGSSGTLGNAVVELHSGTSGNQVRGINRPSGGILVEDDNLSTPTIATSVSGTPSSWTLTQYVQAGNSDTALIAGGTGSFNAPAITDVPLTVNATSGQTADLTDWIVNGTIKASITAAGAFNGTVPLASLPAAPANSVCGNTTNSSATIACTTSINITGSFTGSNVSTTSTASAGGWFESQGTVPSFAGITTSIFTGSPTTVSTQYFQYLPSAPYTGFITATASTAAVFPSCTVSGGAVGPCGVTSGGTYGETPACWITGTGTITTTALCHFTMSSNAISTVVLDNTGAGYVTASPNATNEVAIASSGITGTTGSGTSLVLSASPTITGTITATNLNASGSLNDTGAVLSVSDDGSIHNADGMLQVTGTGVATQTDAFYVGRSAGSHPVFDVNMYNQPAGFNGGGVVEFGYAGEGGGAIPAIFYNETSGYVAVQPANTGALGTSVNTLQAATDTFVYRATTDTLTNKTISGSSNTLSAIALSSLASQSADTVVANASGSSAAPTAVAFPTSGTNGCAGATNALIYNTSTHSLGCNTISTGGSPTLNTVAAATGTATINSANNVIVWNWAGTSSNTCLFCIGENTASTTGPTYLMQVSTAAGSVASALSVANSITGSQTVSSLVVNPTWNTTGVVDAALLVNPTCTACGAGSILADFQVGGTSKADIDKSGNINIASGATIGGNGNAANINVCGGSASGGCVSSTSGQVGGVIVNGATNSSNNSAAKAGYAILAGGGLSNATPNAAALEGATQVAVAYLKGSAVAAVGDVLCATTTAYTVTDCSHTGPAVNIVGIAASTSNPIFVITDGVAPVKLSATLTAIGDTVCMGTTTDGQAVDSTGVAVCATAGTSIGVIVADSGSPVVLNGSAPTATALSTTLPLVHLHLGK